MGQDCLAQETAFDPASPYYLVLLVDAKHLDYTNFQSLCDSLKNSRAHGYVGHAWIVLSGVRNGKRVVIEGGHSGELGLVQPRYLDGVIGLAKQQEKNPIRYLHQTLNDGFFQHGPGVHQPTFAVRLELTEKQFEEIFLAIHPTHYDFRSYSLTSNQCVTFVAKVACLAGLHLEHEVSLEVPSHFWIEGKQYALWHDPQYNTIRFSSPDLLEKSLIDAVRAGVGRVALQWYTHVYTHRE